MKFDVSPDKQKRQGPKASAAFRFFSLLVPWFQSCLAKTNPSPVLLSVLF
ncbi:hypothetical protein [Faecalibacterium sp. An192]|nr:hypothetical protein [Faecalibacterium sp. An192]